MFDMHMLNPNGVQEVRKLKTEMNMAVSKALTLMPEGREKQLFKTHLETAMFYGTKAVASKDGNFSEIIKFVDGESNG